jgi:hypothetical protein
MAKDKMVINIKIVMKRRLCGGNFLKTTVVKIPLACIRGLLVLNPNRWRTS